jgi:hypothetical protein
MATSKTGSFWLTEEVKTDTQGTAAQGTIDLGAYVDVGDQQAVAIEQVDFIVQVYDTALDTYINSFTGSVAANDQFQVDFQLSSLNPGTTLISADDNALIASGVVLYDEATNVQSTGTDFFPDSFGKLDESYMVVNDSLYLVAVPIGVLTLDANHTIQTTCRIRARIVKLSTKDWMAIAIQSTASDN